MADALPVLYRDEQLVAVHKPAGLLVHRSPIDRHETRFALQLLRDQIGQRVYPVHRLDKPTSGVLLFALSPEVAGGVAGQFADHTVAKQYLAVVRGFCPDEGTVNHALTDKDDGSRRGARGSRRPPRQASTAYRCLARTELPVAVERYPSSRYSLVALYPREGRRHQLRRHMKHLGYPIIGDAKHGKGVHNRFFREHYGVDRLLLACTRLRLAHPNTGRMLSISAEPEGCFDALLTALGWQSAARTALRAPWPAPAGVEGTGALDYSAG